MKNSVIHALIAPPRGMLTRDEPTGEHKHVINRGVPIIDAQLGAWTVRLKQVAKWSASWNRPEYVSWLLDRLLSPHCHGTAPAYERPGTAPRGDRSAAEPPPHG